MHRAIKLYVRPNATFPGGQVDFVSGVVGFIPYRVRLRGCMPAAGRQVLLMILHVMDAVRGNVVPSASHRSGTDSPAGRDLRLACLLVGWMAGCKSLGGV